jgi:4-hydroxybenzoate polyprenyltransferase
MNASDIPQNSTVERLLPAWAIPYSRLMRLDRPIGTWLLLLPGWWGIWMGLSQPGTTLQAAIWLSVLFAVGALIMRGAGCVVNDIVDRDFDAQVTRTATRPIPSGQVSVFRAVAFVGCLAGLGLIILLQMNKLTWLVGCSSLVLIVIYPFAKRFTGFPQAFLGLTFNYGALMGWTAVTGMLSTPSILMYIAGFFWTIGYDTIYAHQDKGDDVRIGVKSTALTFGDKTKIYIVLCYCLTLALLAAAGYLAELGWGFYPGLALTGFFLIWHVRATDINDPSNCLKQFKATKFTGMIFLLAIFAGLLTL